MKKCVLFASLALVVFASGAFASDISPARSLRAIDLDLKAGNLDLDLATVYKVYAFFEQSSLPRRYHRFIREGDHFTCATTFLLRLRNTLPKLSPEARREIRSVLPYALDSGLEFDDTPPEKGGAKALADYPNAYYTSNVHYTDHFAVRWGDGFDWDADASVTLAEFEDILEYVWQTEVVDMGYPAPYQSDQYYTDFYIGNSGDASPNIDFSGAYTTLYYEYDTMSHVVFHPTIFHYEGAVQEVSAHEFFHVLQFGIALTACPHYMFSENDASIWTVEATAVWTEDYVYDDVNAYVYFVDEHMAKPEETLLSCEGVMDYGRSIFYKYISENWGGWQAVWEIWNECHGNLFLSVDSYLGEEGASMVEAFPEFAQKVLLRDFEDGNLFDSVSIHASFSNYPVDRDFSGVCLPQSWGANYLKFYPGEDDTLNFRFSGDDKYQNRTVKWDVSALKMRSNGTYEVEKLNDGNSNQGTLTITGVGTEWNTVNIIVAPMVDYMEANVAGIAFTLEAREGWDPFPDDDADDDTGGESDISCLDLLTAIYVTCEFQILSGSDVLAAQEALDLCEEDDGPWDCLKSCSDESDSCDQYADCALGQCGVTFKGDSSSGGDDDDDDGGCGCSCPF